MSSEAQQVSAAFTSGVNPKIADCCCLSLVAQHDRSGPCFSRSAGGEARGNLATDDNVNPRGPAVDLAEALRAGWFELWYQPKIGSQLRICRAPKRSFVCAIRDWELFNLPISCSMSAIGVPWRSRNLSSLKHSPIGVISSPSNVLWIYRSIFRSRLSPWPVFSSFVWSFLVRKIRHFQPMVISAVLPRAASF